MKSQDWVVRTLTNEGPKSGSDANPLIIVVTGPSGVGKDAVIGCIAEAQSGFHFTVTATTRSPRPDEQNGVNHHFLSKTEFENLIAADELLEWAEVYGSLYGTPKAQIRSAISAGKHVLLRIDVQGAMQVKRIVPDALLVFVSPPNKSALINRLKLRGVNDEHDIERRIEAADAEMAQAHLFDYNVVNHEGKLAETVDTILNIVKQESARIPPRVVNV